MRNSVEPVSYSVADAKAALGIGRSKIYELMNSGVLRRVKIGRKTLIPASDIRALIEDNAQ